MPDPYNSGLMYIPSSLDVLRPTMSISCPCLLKQGMSLIFTFLLRQITLFNVLQGVSTACYTEPCISYDRVVRPFVCPSHAGSL